MRWRDTPVMSGCRGNEDEASEYRLKTSIEKGQ